MSFPVIQFDHHLAADLNACLKAMRRCERMTPELRDNPQWKQLRDNTLERFEQAFKAIQ